MKKRTKNALTKKWTTVSALLLKTARPLPWNRSGSMYLSCKSGLEPLFLGLFAVASIRRMRKVYQCASSQQNPAPPGGGSDSKHPGGIR